MNQRYLNAKNNLARCGLLGLAERVAEKRHVTLFDMLEPRRGLRSAVLARRELWNVVRDTLAFSFQEIAKLTGHDTSTVQTGVRRRQDELQRTYSRHFSTKETAALQTHVSP